MRGTELDHQMMACRLVSTKPLPETDPDGFLAAFKCRLHDCILISGMVDYMIPQGPVSGHNNCQKAQNCAYQTDL